MITARINDDSEVILENSQQGCRLRIRSVDNFVNINTNKVRAEEVLQTIRKTRDALQMLESVVSDWIDPKESA